MTDDKTQALVAAQICREMEQAEESARLGKRPTGETWTARHSKDTREVREEEIAVVNAEVEGSYSATDSTNSTLVEANKVRFYAWTTGSKPLTPNYRGTE